MLADPLLAERFADGESPLDWTGREGEARAMTMNPVGPIADRFVKDRTFISIIMGPWRAAIVP